MDVQEVIRLLGEISLVDDRVVKTDEAEQKAQVRMWAVALSEVPLDYAGEAVGRHYAESAYPIMPKDITARWRDTVRERLSRQVGTFEPSHHPELDPDDKYGNAYVAALRAGRTAVMTGAEQPRELPELVGRVGRTVEAAPATEGYLAAKAALFPKRDKPAGPTGPPELAVGCPACEAAPHRPCQTTKRGRPMTGTHPSRRDAYAAQQGAAA
ncbi:zinc finger domain-containing protein [Streptomyces indicus]|uniref:DNA-binding phage zinc finger domain-containing protein n=1 Tax=Streptomyces indicus TaxID=417292 RepID=A0A1G9J8V2_9ACTN|nr:hypothetical protein [Streptomyces indicus]SDL33646.1 hypothetical protein SAMN05421806_12839 [Streptomyces indicus]